MTVKVTPRHVLLATGLFGTLIATAWVSRFGDGTPAAAVARRSGPVADLARATGTNESSGRLGVNVATLRSKETARRPARDAFGSKSFYVAPPPTPVRADAAPPPPSAPPLPFRYVGLIQEEGALTLFLESGERLYSVKVGDVIDGNYRVEEISPQGVEFLYLPMNMRQSLNIENPS
jgi:hypothetical protein